MKNIIIIVGARPNYMKAFPVIEALGARDPIAKPVLVHTGQHYDANMSKVFFEDLGLPEPDINLGVGSGSHAAQTARVMIAYEQVLDERPCDMTVVVGDVNSTMAAALVAVKKHIPVAHIEAGLRSGDRSMPEEINRLVTDAVADRLFTPSEDADRNLRGEGIPPERIHRVGNVMIDSLVRLDPVIRRSDILHGLHVDPGAYVLVTLHRPSNVDDPAVLTAVMRSLAAVADVVPVLFTVHPRTRRAMERAGPVKMPKTLRLMEPLGYLDFQRLLLDAGAVITDSGGIQEETSYRGIPCFTVRSNTERPVTIEQGTNRLVKPEDDWPSMVNEALARPKTPACIPLWDGHSAERIADIIVQV